jgi:hypothetical protein
MSKRMIIERYVPAAEPAPSDGLPPMLALPPRDGVMAAMFIGKRIQVDAWMSESIVKFAKGYARTSCVALAIELDAVKAERDALAAEVARFRA